MGVNASNYRLIANVIEERIRCSSVRRNISHIRITVAGNQKKNIQFKHYIHYGRS